MNVDNQTGSAPIRDPLRNHLALGSHFNVARTLTAACVEGRIVYFRDNLYANGCPILEDGPQIDDL